LLQSLLSYCCEKTSFIFFIILAAEDVKVEMINAHLPAQIHVLAVKRATKGFNSKSSCDARTYSYMLPTFAFAPSGVELTESYRITSEVINNVGSILKNFEGTHNFHNFTARKYVLNKCE